MVAIVPRGVRVPRRVRAIAVLPALQSRKVWYKKYITSAQIVQFMTGTIVSTIFVVLKASGRGCTSHYGPAIFSNCVNLTFLYMFYQFYKKSYSKPVDKPKKAKGN